MLFTDISHSYKTRTGQWMARTHARETPTTLLHRSRLIFFPATNNIDGCYSEIYYIMHTMCTGIRCTQATKRFVWRLTQNKVEKLCCRVTAVPLLSFSILTVWVWNVIVLSNKLITFLRSWIILWSNIRCNLPTTVLHCAQMPNTMDNDIFKISCSNYWGVLILYTALKLTMVNDLPAMIAHMHNIITM